MWTFMKHLHFGAHHLCCMPENFIHTEGWCKFGDHFGDHLRNYLWIHLWSDIWNDVRGTSEISLQVNSEMISEAISKFAPQASIAISSSIEHVYWKIEENYCFISQWHSEKQIYRQEQFDIEGYSINENAWALTCPQSLNLFWILSFEIFTIGPPL